VTTAASAKRGFLHAFAEVFGRWLMPLWPGKTKNVVQNPGFETGQLEPAWHVVLASGGGGVTTAQAHSGSHSLELGDGFTVEQSWPLGINPKSIVSPLSMWVMTPGPGGNARVQVEYRDGSMTEDGLPVTDTWSKFEVELQDKKVVKRITFIAGELMSHFFVDDVGLHCRPGWLWWGLPSRGRDQ
jgi:hypothetical protein